MLVLATLAAPSPRRRAASSPMGSISEIRFEGNATIPPEKIKPKLLSQVGQPLRPQKIDADVKTPDADQLVLRRSRPSTTSRRPRAASTS